MSITTGGTGNISLQTISGTNGAVTLTAGGSILDGSNGTRTNVVDSSLSALAKGGVINLTTSIATLTSAATTTSAPVVGKITIANTGKALTVDKATTLNGAISLSNNEQFTIGGTGITAGGTGTNITLTTIAANPANMNDMILSANVSTLSGILAITADDGITTTAGTLSAPTST